MNSMKSISYALMTVVLLVSVSYAQMNCPQGGMQGGMHDGMKGRDRASGGMGMRDVLQLRKELALTNEQVRALEKIRMDSAKDSIRRQAEIQTARLDLTTALRQETPDFAAARKTMKQISDLQLQGKLAMLDAMEKSHMTLTKEQRAKLPQLMPQRKGMMMQGMSGSDEEDEE